MIVGAASGLTQSTFNQPSPNRNPLYRTLFNTSILVLTAEASGQVYVVARRHAVHRSTWCLLAGAARPAWPSRTSSSTPCRSRSPSRSQRSRARGGSGETDFAPSGPSYVLGAAAAAVVLAVTESSGYWLALLLTAGAAVPDLQDVPHGRRERGEPGRDSRGRARRHHHDGFAPRDPRIQSRRRADVRAPAHRHPRPARRDPAA